MEMELKFLSIIAGSSANVTQRDLSAKTHLSLGATNALLKKMVEKGLIKIEKLSARTVRYILTPKGMMEKAMKTYDFVKRTYGDILLMKNKLISIAQALPEKSALYLYGEKNEVFYMIIMLLEEVAREECIIYKVLCATDTPVSKSTVIIWDSQDESNFTGVKCINILDRIV